MLGCVRNPVFTVWIKSVINLDCISLSVGFSIVIILIKCI